MQIALNYIHHNIVDMKNGNRYCPICGHKLQKWGHSSSGAQRWYCCSCKKCICINTKQKITIKNKLWITRYLKYVTNTKRHIDYSWNRVTFWRNTKFIRDKNIFIPNDREVRKVIHLDGKCVNGKCYLIASDGKYVIGYSLVEQEDRRSWTNLISCFPPPEYVVCDGEKGLLSAINDVWPKAKIQRCIFHVWMNIRQKLTLKPETQPGVELLCLGKTLLKIKTLEQMSQWLANFQKWKDKYKDFINEKSIDYNTGEVWYTHKKLRSAALNLSLLILNNNLFWYLKDQSIPKTNNCLEGGINSPLTSLLNSHRGTNFYGQQKIVELYLLKRSKYWNLLSQILNIKKH